MITFIKIAAYDTGKNSSDPFTYVRNLLMQKENPPSLDPGSIDCSKFDYVFCSPLLRAKQSIKINPNQKVQYLNILSEVKFDLEKLSSTDEFATNGSEAVRQAFIKGFKEDRLDSSQKQLQDEIIELADLLRPLNGSVAVISHTFRLKLIETYLINQGELKTTPNIKMYDFKQSFDILHI